MNMYQNKIPYTTCLLSICIANNIQACDVRKRPLFLIMVRQFHKHIYKYSAILIAAVYHLYRSYALTVFAFLLICPQVFFKNLFVHTPPLHAALASPVLFARTHSLHQPQSVSPKTSWSFIQDCSRCGKPGMNSRHHQIRCSTMSYLSGFSYLELCFLHFNYMS